MDMDRIINILLMLFLSPLSSQHFESSSLSTPCNFSSSSMSTLYLLPFLSNLFKFLSFEIVKEKVSNRCKTAIPPQINSCI